jgi:hypothetical protein
MNKGRRITDLIKGDRKERYGERIRRIINSGGLMSNEREAMVGER